MLAVYRKEFDDRAGGCGAFVLAAVGLTYSPLTNDTHADADADAGGSGGEPPQSTSTSAAVVQHQQQLLMRGGLGGEPPQST